MSSPFPPLPSNAALPTVSAATLPTVPRVSVIIPTYNFGHFIEESVGSVLAQIVTDLEVLVVDDGSTDDTLARLARIDDARLRVLRIPKQGVGAARNHGIDHARGQYVAFLDADDRWRHDKLTRQVAILDDEPDVGFVFTNFVRFDDHGFHTETQFDLVPQLRAIPTRQTRAGGGRVIEGDTFSELAPMTQLPCWTQTMLVRARVIRSVRFPPDLRLSQDLSFVLNVYRVARGAMIDDPLVEVRRHVGNSYRRPDQKLRPDIDAIARVASQVSAEPHRTVIRRRLGRAWLALGYHHFWNGRVRRAVYAYARALPFPGAGIRAAAHIVAAPAAPLLQRMLRRGKR